MAVTVVWEARFETGIDAIDTQHRKLFALAQRAFDAHAAGDVSATRLHVIELYSYTRRHFDDEEAAMVAAGYPKLEAHLALHEALVARLDTVAVADAPADVLQWSVRALIFDWLMDHISVADRAFAEYVRARAVPAG